MNALRQHATETDNSSLNSAVVHYESYLQQLRAPVIAFHVFLDLLDTPSSATSMLIRRFIGVIDGMSAEHATYVAEIQSYTVEHPEFKEAFDLADRYRLVCENTVRPAMLTMLEPQTPAALKVVIDKLRVDGVAADAKLLAKEALRGKRI